MRIAIINPASFTVTQYGRYTFDYSWVGKPADFFMIWDDGQKREQMRVTSSIPTSKEHAEDINRLLARFA